MRSAEKARDLFRLICGTWGSSPRLPIAKGVVNAPVIAESEVDTSTLAKDTNLLLNWGAGNDSGLEDKIVHMWALFDQHYYFNMDGSVSYSN